MPDPNASLRAIRRQLLPGAIGLIEVPNFDMMVRNGLFSEFIADHLFYFSRDTLASTLHWNGFEVIGIEELRSDYVISAVVRNREPLNLSEFSRLEEQLLEQIRNFIGRFLDRRVAIWGAGHQALAILALSGVASSIRYVVDSAPFKQGKFTPTTHLLVVPPEMLKSDPVDAVIVMAGGYSEEVAKIVVRDYGDRIKIAVLRETGLDVFG
jgi:hypothetical protein